MGLPQTIKRYTPQEYYYLEHRAECRSEYYKGEIFAMSEGTVVHSLICANIGGELRQRLKGKPCAPYESNVRIRTEATGLCTYPDASVFCGGLEYDREDPESETVINPVALFEVLSKSTEAYDRGFKADSYRQIASLRAYVLVSQESAHVEVYERRPAGVWQLSEAKGLDAQIEIPSIGIMLPLREIYDRVEFPQAPSPRENLPPPI